MNLALASAPVVRHLRGVGRGWSVDEVATGEAVDRVPASVAASFSAMLAQGDPARIKICANPDCLWVVYDESRNHTRRWCDAKGCGNPIKVRRGGRSVSRERSDVAIRNWAARRRPVCCALSQVWR